MRILVGDNMDGTGNVFIATDIDLIYSRSFNNA